MSFRGPPNLRHLKDLLQTGAAKATADAQRKAARLHGFENWPKLKAHAVFSEEIERLKQAIDTNDILSVSASSPGTIVSRR